MDAGNAYAGGMRIKEHTMEGREWEREEGWWMDEREMLLRYGHASQKSSRASPKCAKGSPTRLTFSCRWRRMGLAKRRCRRSESLSPLQLRLLLVNCFGNIVSALLISHRDFRLLKIYF